MRAFTRTWTVLQSYFCVSYAREWYTRKRWLTAPVERVVLNHRLRHFQNTDDNLQACWTEKRVKDNIRKLPEHSFVGKPKRLEKYSQFHEEIKSISIRFEVSPNNCVGYHRSIWRAFTFLGRDCKIEMKNASISPIERLRMSSNNCAQSSLQCGFDIQDFVLPLLRRYGTGSAWMEMPVSRVKFGDLK